MRKFIKSLYTGNLLYICFACIAFLFVLGYIFAPMFPAAQIALLVLSAASLTDILLLYRFSGGIKAERIIADRLSNGDDNPVIINIENKYPFDVFLKVIDEIPVQFQERNFGKYLHIDAGKNSSFTYSLRPVRRGEYNFGALNIYASSRLRLFRKKYVFEANKDVRVYPSYLQMNKYQLLAITNELPEGGIKKIRKMGNTMEFDQIRRYINGDDPRTINWKATARKNDIMVNQYQDERSQPVYCVIDTGRTMKMPFEGLSLLDYAVNSSLVLSSISLKKHDKPGLLLFGRDIDFFLKADQKKDRMNKINDALYKLDAGFMEPNYPLLYSFTRTNIKQRSLIFLFTNFETLGGMQRHLEYLRMMAKKHLVVVVFFKNTELYRLMQAPAGNIRDVYTKITAEKMAFDKHQIVKELNKHGIMAIYSEPACLTVDSINKYLEIKAKRLL